MLTDVIRYNYPVDISTTVFSYSCAVQYHAILHMCGYWMRVIGRTLGLCRVAKLSEAECWRLLNIS